MQLSKNLNLDDESANGVRMDTPEGPPLSEGEDDIVERGDMADGKERETDGSESAGTEDSPFVLRLAEYAGTPLTGTKRYSYYSSTNPMNDNIDASKYELLNDTEESFADFVKYVGKEERWSINVGWKKARFNASYLSKHISLSPGDDKDDSDNIDLLRCIETIMEEEKLEEGEEWYCSNCKELRIATKKLDLWRAPNVLIIHMKRFQYAQGAMFVRRNKLDNMVNFPIEGLDIKHCIKGPSDEDHVYDLFAVSEHIGGMGGGHYTAVCKNYRDGKWYDCNDSSVSEAQASDAVTPKAYVLFYKRRSGGIPADQLVPKHEIRDPSKDSGDYEMSRYGTNDADDFRDDALPLVEDKLIDMDQVD
jgi:hypothetical protein